MTIVLIVVGSVVMLLVMILLVRVIQKNQLTAKEHEAIRDANEEPYESMAGDPEEDPEEDNPTEE